jgi:hypothetical protein
VKQVEPKRDPKAKKKHPEPKVPPDPPTKPAKPEVPPSDVTITLYVGPHGKAQSVGFASAKTEIGEIWAQCAEKAALAWRLPDPHGMVAKLAIRYRAR